MHELALARTLFNEAQEMALRVGMDRINYIKVKLGVASGIDVDTLRHSFMEHLFPESIAEDAEVEIVFEPLIAKCIKCQQEITQVGPGGGCPKCGSGDLDIIGGIKVTIDEIG